MDLPLHLFLLCLFLLWLTFGEVKCSSSLPAWRHILYTAVLHLQQQKYVYKENFSRLLYPSAPWGWRSKHHGLGPTTLGGGEKERTKREGKKIYKLCIIFLLSTWKRSSQRRLKGIKFKIPFKSQTNLRVPFANLRKSSCVESWCGNSKDMQFSIHSQAVGLSALEEKFHSFTALEHNWGFHKK